MIVAAGLSPAWQQILQFDRVQLGEVNRAQQALWCASGKVLNVGIALRHLRAESQTVTILGGPPRDAIAREFATHGAPLVDIQTACVTRICTTLLDDGAATTTELVENASAITMAELDAFRVAFRDVVAQAKCVVLTGSIPPGVPPTIFAEMLRDAPTGCTSVLDIRGRELVAALAERPTLVKPNREELGMTVGRTLESDADTLAAMREICDAGAAWVLVTSGPRPALLASRDFAYRLQGPRVSVVNPIAAGDCAAAGIATRLASMAVGDRRPEQVVDAVCWGLAAAANNVEMLLPARLSVERVREIAEQIDIEAI